MTSSIRIILLVSTTAMLALAACGRVGALEQPAPLYGAKVKADYQAKKAAAAEAAKASKDEGRPEPLALDTPGAPTGGAPPQDTLRSQPAPGMRPLPNAPPSQGALPDPYNHPQ
jgi:predicted small lipoprotein YifL